MTTKTKTDEVIIIRDILEYFYDSDDTTLTMHYMVAKNILENLKEHRGKE